jgi:hypothetical protein
VKENEVVPEDMPEVGEAGDMPTKRSPVTRQENSRNRKRNPHVGPTVAFELRRMEDELM